MIAPARRYKICCFSVLFYFCSPFCVSVLISRSGKTKQSRKVEKSLPHPPSGSVVFPPFLGCCVIVDTETQNGGRSFSLDGKRQRRKMAVVVVVCKSRRMGLLLLTLGCWLLAGKPVGLLNGQP